MAKPLVLSPLNSQHPLRLLIYNPADTHCGAHLQYTRQQPFIKASPSFILEGLLHHVTEAGVLMWVAR